jgi:hypothetical protein
MQGRSRFWVGAAVIVVAVSGIVGVIRVSGVRTAHAPDGASNAYSQAIEQAKLAGIPVTPQALQEQLPPAEQNAAPIYTQLTDLLDKHPFSKQDKIAEWLTAPQMPSEEQFERVRKALAHRADVMSLIHRAALRPHCIFVRDWTYPNAILDKENGKMRAAGRLIVGESALSVRDGKPLDGVKDLADGFRIADHIASGNELYTYMTAENVDTLVLHGLRNVLYRAGDKPGVADAVRSVIDKECRLPDLARAFRTEAGMHIIDLEVLRKLGPTYLNNFIGNNSSPPLHMMPQLWDHFIDDNGSVILRLQRAEAAGAELSYPQSFAALSAVEHEADKESSPMHLLVTVYSMHVADFAQRRAEWQAQVDITRAAASLLAYKSRHGSFPMTLAEALKPVPLDPFDGKPLRYRREGDGFVVFSIGRNGTCAGGNPNRKPARYEADVTFHCPFPAYYAGPLKDE